MTRLVSATLALLMLAGLCSVAAAQSLEERRDKKLSEPWVTKAAWITDYDKARAESKKSGKAIFGYFTRSYAP